MVAPHVGTQLTRSLVRVPNSGRDRRAGAVLHDLSRVSSAAALVPITSYFALGILPSTSSPQPPPPHLSTDLLKFSAKALQSAATAQVSTPSGTRGVMSRRDVRTSGGMPRGDGRATYSSATVNSTGSRKRPMQQDNNRIATEKIRSPKVPRTTSTSISGRPIQQSRRPTPRLVVEDFRTREELLREREQLRAENMALKLELSRRVQQTVPSGAAGH